LSVKKHPAIIHKEEEDGMMTVLPTPRSIPPEEETTAYYTIAVGWTSQRPVISDQHVSYVVAATTDTFAGSAEAKQIAAQMVQSIEPSCIMVTSTVITDAEL
jgi:hypothetical protein